ncbi:phage tail tape measure protein [Methylomonas fluvii]|uniref:Phage tail tape measure protein n=1 Tax=Methylomonas fluvii TaxID=1854564 RepID=A0ABR9DI39_9GAMM|nr:phage tail tape measure protein [Methylomonas fluvii]MBD9362774.1 phage tail tape measure protein [Methylomonas fluvii]
MSKDFELKALITAVDKLSPTLRVMSKNLNVFRRQLNLVGQGAPLFGAGFAASLAMPARAFAEFESAGVALQNTLMNKNGVAAGFEALNKVAVELGNKLPGNTADFQRMATVMKANSMDTNTLINGGLKAAAYLGVATKELGETYDSSALGIAKISNVFGVANQDFVALADTMQRARHIGVGFEDFTSAMSKAGGPLKALKVQGIEVANALAPMVALLTQAGIDPSEAGTGVKEMISAAARVGKFTTVENLVKDIEKMAKLNPAKLFSTFEKTFGKEHASKAMVLAAGGYGDMVKKFADQGDVYQRVNNSLGTLSNTVDTLSGTLENMQARLGGTYAPQLKQLSGGLTEAAEKMAGFINDHPQAVMTMIKTAGALVGLKVAAWGLAGGIGVLNTAMKMNPLMILAQAAVVAAPLIIDNWDTIVGRFKSGIANIVDFFKPLKEMLQYMVDWVTDNEFLRFIGSIPQYFGESVMKALPKLPDLSVQGSGDMRPPGFHKQSLLGAGNGAVSVKVSFENAPSGLRVAPVQTSGIAQAKPVNVGYRTVGTNYGI